MRASHPVSLAVLLCALVASLTSGAAGQSLPGEVLASSEIDDTHGGLVGELEPDFAVEDWYASAIAHLGDIDGDGSGDVAVGAPGAGVDGNDERGAIYVLRLHADASVKAAQKIGEGLGGFGGDVDGDDRFGASVAAIGDVDDDGVVDLAVGAPYTDGAGDRRGALWILLMAADHTVKDEVLITESTGGLAAALVDSDLFGAAVVGLGDLDGDGVEDLAVGAPGRQGSANQDGAVWILFLATDGTVAAHQRIANGEGGLVSLLFGDRFGASLADVGDLDGDGARDLAVGAPGRTSNQGSVWTLLLDTDGTVLAETRIEEGTANFPWDIGTVDFLGASLAALGDVDGDGVEDLAAGAPNDDDGTMPAANPDRGAFYTLFLNADGTLKDSRKISSWAGNFGGDLDSFDRFGSALAAIGDRDGDGAGDVWVGAPFDDDIASDVGVAWLLHMTANGTVKDEARVDGDTVLVESANVLDDGDRFGAALAPLGDLDGDGRLDLAVGGDGDDAGGSNRGAVWILFLDEDDAVADQQRISALEGGFAGALDDGDRFGAALALLGDLDGDGTTELAVGAPGDDDGGTSGAISDRGAVWLLSLADDGTVAGHSKISSTAGGFGGALIDVDRFGTAVANVGDLDGNGTPDLAVGAPGDDDGGAARGAVWILFLDTDGSVLDEQLISDSAGGFTGTLDDDDEFGAALAGLGDVDGDGVPDLAVGAHLDDDGRPEAGAVWILMLDADGTVEAHQKISADAGGLAEDLVDDDEFGYGLGALGDLDNDGVPDLAAGFIGADDGGPTSTENRGALIALFLAPDGTVKREQKISSTSGNFGGAITAGDVFGCAVTRIGDVDGDGVADVAVGAFGDNGDSFFGEYGAAWVLRLDSSTWADVGPALAGTAGVPTLTGIGSMVAGEPVTLALDDALPGSTAYLIISGVLLNAPFKGGVLVPHPDPPGFVVPLPTGPAGGFAIPGLWPVGIPSDLTILYQCWIVDGAGPVGFASTAGLAGTTP